MSCAVSTFDSSGRHCTCGSAMLVSRHPWTSNSSQHTMYPSYGSMEKRLLRDSDDTVVPATKRRKAAEKEASAVIVDEDMPEIVSTDLQEEIEEIEASNEAAECSSTMCRDVVPCPNKNSIRVNIPLDHMPYRIHSLHHTLSSTPALAIVPYLGKLPDTQTEKNELDTTEEKHMMVLD